MTNVKVSVTCEKEDKAKAGDYFKEKESGDIYIISYYPEKYAFVNSKTGYPEKYAFVNIKTGIAWAGWHNSISDASEDGLFESVEKVSVIAEMS